MRRSSVEGEIELFGGKIDGCQAVTERPKEVLKFVCRMYLVSWTLLIVLHQICTKIHTCQFFKIPRAYYRASSWGWGVSCWHRKLFRNCDLESEPRSKHEKWPLKRSWQKSPQEHKEHGWKCRADQREADDHSIDRWWVMRRSGEDNRREKQDRSPFTQKTFDQNWEFSLPSINILEQSRAKRDFCHPIELFWSER